MLTMGLWRPVQLLCLYGSALQPRAQHCLTNLQPVLLRGGIKSAFLTFLLKQTLHHVTAVVGHHCCFFCVYLQPYKITHL